MGKFEDVLDEALVDAILSGEGAIVTQTREAFEEQQEKYAKAVTLLKDIEQGEYKYYESTCGDEQVPDYFTKIRELLSELGEL